MAKILVDQDGILADCTGDWCDWIAEDYGIDFTKDDVTEWDMAKCPKIRHLGGEAIYRYLFKPYFFETLPPLPGALDGLRQLYYGGHEVFIVTSPSGPQSIVEKLNWLKKYAPFIGEKNVIFSHHKSLIKADAIIDDRGSTLELYKDAWPDALVLGIEYPYNAYAGKLEGVQLFASYKDTAGAWKSIVQAIEARHGA